MKNVSWCGTLAFGWCLLFVGIDACPAENSGTTYDRQVVFELTFPNKSLTWLGDPASPTATAYVTTAAQPLATDVAVYTILKSQQHPTRRYYGEARIAMRGVDRTVLAFTKNREQIIGTIGEDSRFLPNRFYHDQRELLPSWPIDANELSYDPQRNQLYRKLKVPGPLVSEQIDFLPLDIRQTNGQAVAGEFEIDFAPSGQSTDRVGTVSLKFHGGQRTLTLATADVPVILRQANIRLESFDNTTGRYFAEADYRPGASEPVGEGPMVTVAVTGAFSSSVDHDGEALVLGADLGSHQQEVVEPAIKIDGRFDDWRNISGVDDPRGDVMPYLEYIPDVDLLEFKVAHDDQHIYLYARVAGRVGYSHPDGGRSYFYAYMDVDRNSETGFLPTRDDDCYFGVDLGDDCEVQFEFVGNALRKTFYGFCGLGGDDHVLRQQVTLGKSQYGRFDANGVERANYKAEYIYRNGRTVITEDRKQGTSDSILIGVSPDGSEVEVVSAFTGFLNDENGKPTVGLGQAIDLAVGMECDSKAYPTKRRWAADSTIPIRGYTFFPATRLSP